MSAQGSTIAAGCYLVMSLITFIAFALDKRAAVRQRRRTPEATLHTLELLGGFPGAFAAMALLRHKNRKASFWIITVLITIVHAAAWGWWLFGRGRA